MSRERICAGSEFQVDGADTENATAFTDGGESTAKNKGARFATPQSAQSLPVLCSRLKTYLFRRSFL